VDEEMKRDGKIFMLALQPAAASAIPFHAQKHNEGMNEALNF
jgi:hypothetical protein